jgi:PqqA peptide cyclase
VTGLVCELTPRCNLGCGFCYNPWRRPQSTQPEPLLPAAFAALLDSTARATDATWLTFAGGEPLLYAGLETLLADLSQRLPHLPLGLASNGTLLTEARLAALVSSGLGYVELSLFAASAPRYQALTGKDALATAQAAIPRVKAQGLPLTVACTLLADGLDELEDVMLTALALGADALALNPFTATGHGAAREADFGLTLETLARFLAMANHVAATLPIPVSVTLPVEDCLLPHANYPHLHFGSCLCGQDKWVIDPQGQLRTCEQNETPIGNLAQHSFAELATRPAVQAFRRQHRHPHCSACPSFANCGGGCRFATRSRA